MSTHLVDGVLVHDALDMEHQKAEHIAMDLRKLLEEMVDRIGAATGVLDFIGAKETRVDVHRDERSGKRAQVELDDAADGVDVEAVVGDIEVVRLALEAGLDGLNLAVGSGFTVDSFFSDSWVRCQHKCFLQK